jgi:hypothetical protein
MPQQRILACLLVWATVCSARVEAAQISDFDGNVLGFQQKSIYHSPAGYTSWIGLWQMPGGAIQCDFTQIAGPVDAPLWNAPILESTNSGGSWSVADPNLPATPAFSNPRSPGYYQMTPAAHRGMWVSANGQTMVRPVWDAPDANGYVHGYVQRSTNGGSTWSSPIQVPAGSYGSYSGVYPTLIKQVTLGDGNPALVLMAGVCPSGYTGPGAPNASLLKEMFISTDQGQTWGNPINLMPQSAGVCEESDFVQLPSGDLMWIHRAEHWSADGAFLGTTRMESISKRQGNTFVSQPATEVPFPHSGFPCELLTREGIILDLCTTGSHWSGDNGNTWHDLLLNGSPLTTYYYPKALQAADGTIIVLGHNGSDDPYGTVDQSVMQQTFRLPMTVPEPSMSALLGTGAGGIMVFFWRRRTRSCGR